MGRINLIFITLFMLIIGSCAPQQDIRPRQSPFDPYNNTGQSSNVLSPIPAPSQQPQQNATQANGRVALLLPLSGAQSPLGKSMLNAAQMALFDVNDPSFTLVPIDTKGTPQGASAAVQKAASMNVSLILGPLLSTSVQAAGRTASRYNLNLVSFTTNASAIGGNIMTLGILPSDQGARLADFALKNNLRRVAVVTSNDAFSKIVTDAFLKNARANNIQITQNITLDSRRDAVAVAQTLKNARASYDAIMIPFGNPDIAILAQALGAQQLSPANVPWLGTGVWEDQAIKNNPIMANAYFTAPSAQLRQNFEQNYASIYSEKPQRLASLAYDAVALSVILLRQNQGQRISTTALLNPNGFSGIDGIFRFQQSGQVERGLAIHRITSLGRSTIIEQAPSSF